MVPVNEKNTFGWAGSITEAVMSGIEISSASPRREPRASRRAHETRRSPLARAAGSRSFRVNLMPFEAVMQLMPRSCPRFSGGRSSKLDRLVGRFYGFVGHRVHPVFDF